MSKPERFIYSSDFATLKNDDDGLTTVTVVGGAVIGAGATYAVSSDLTVGSQLGESRIRISSSKIGSSRHYAGYLGVNRTGTVGGSPFSYTIYALVSRINATQVRCICIIQNPYGAALTAAAGNETFTFKINTFIPPVK
ncbi:hypothetical protein [Mycobacteroides abscessus]|uniref:hypothetical protein n=1 Tax=Mycobacteroides abscessus TaxID=36809 RepID=UPI00092949CE|nr:hypothetical protein [Mycobacteroides abscessus]SIC60149.1 Uncharacterised protein [Mycobacteroides abscessus subsp. abscessus]